MMKQQAVEDYIKAIYVLSEERSPVSTSRLAEARDARPASASNMMKRLAEAGFVVYEKQRGVTLTEDGKRVALETLRHHRLIELYLTEELGFGWDEVHEQADQLEHVISEKLEDRIADILGEPEYDPHGDPIPTKEGKIAARKTVALSVLPQGCRAVVTRITESTRSELLRYLADLGIVPGTEVSVVSIAPFDGPLTLQIRNEVQVLGHDLAEKIQVQT